MMEAGGVPTSARELGSGWSVQTHLLTSVLVIAVLIAGIGSWLGIVAMHDAGSQAQRNARFQAVLAASALTSALDQTKPELAQVAQGFPLAALIAAPTRCRLDATHVGVVRAGHIDVVLSDGRVLCSSTAKQGAPPGATQAGAPG